MLNASKNLTPSSHSCESDEESDRLFEPLKTRYSYAWFDQIKNRDKRTPQNDSSNVMEVSSVELRDSNDAPTVDDTTVGFKGGLLNTCLLNI